LGGQRPARGGRRQRQPDWKAIHQQLQQHRHLTLQLVWEDTGRRILEGYRYSWFCERYQHWRSTWMWVLRQEHKAGENVRGLAGPRFPL